MRDLAGTVGCVSANVELSLEPDYLCLAAVAVVFGQSVSRVDDQLCVCAEAFIVDRRVRGTDHDAV